MASLSARAAWEPTLSVLQRFGIASNALSRYLRLVFPSTMPAMFTTPPRVTHAPVPNAGSATLPVLQTSNPASARVTDAVATAQIAMAPATHNL